MPGELFVVRNVANLVPPFETQGKYHGVSAALEFAALNIRVKHIVVLGHSGCGGVRACLDHNAARQTQAEFIVNWMSMLDGARDNVLAAHQHAPEGELRGALEREGVKTSLANLRTAFRASRFSKAAAASSSTARISTSRAARSKCWIARRGEVREAVSAALVIARRALRRSNPNFCIAFWIASLRSQ